MYIIYHVQNLCRERSGNPLQYSCLENPRDGRAWWAAVYGVAQCQTRLKQLSSSNPISLMIQLLTATPLSSLMSPDLLHSKHTELLVL